MDYQPGLFTLDPRAQANLGKIAKQIKAKRTETQYMH